jgi:hypothetical protein
LIGPFITDGTGSAAPPAPQPEFSATQLAPGLVAYRRELGAASPVAGSAPADFRAMFDSQGAGWAGGDATYSLRLPDGRTLWIFNDTLVNTADEQGRATGTEGFVRNSVVVQDGSSLTTVVSGTPQQPTSFLSPPGHPDEWYWPEHAAVEGSSLLLFMNRMHRTPAGGPWGFASAGSDMVQLSLANLAVEGVRHLATQANVTWGTWVMDTGPFTYVYGMEDGRAPTDRWAHLARVPNGQLATAPWQYWDGRGWSDSAHDSARMAKGVSNGFSVVQTHAGYALLSQEPDFSPKLLAATGPTPHGPWSGWREISAGPTLPRSEITYNALAHPEFDADGKLLVSWNTNLRKPALPPLDQAGVYRPVFDDVPLSALEPSRTRS